MKNSRITSPEPSATASAVPLDPSTSTGESSSKTHARDRRDEAIKVLADHGLELEQSARRWRDKLMGPKGLLSQTENLDQGIDDAEVASAAIRVVLTTIEEQRKTIEELRLNAAIGGRVFGSPEAAIKATKGAET